MVNRVVYFLCGGGGDNSSRYWSSLFTNLNVCLLIIGGTLDTLGLHTRRINLLFFLPLSNYSDLERCYFGLMIQYR